MKQFKFKRMTLSDYIVNVFYKVRFWSYRNFFKDKLKNSSSRDKDGLLLTFEDEFNEKTWSPSGSRTKWKIGEGWGLFHPKKMNVYYGSPEIVPNTSTAKFTVKHKPKTFDYEGEQISIPFQVSLLSSQKSFKQQYGRYECRLTLPFDPNVWPSFWTWGSTWPPEIDILESSGGEDGKKVGRNSINLHYGFDKDGTRKSLGGWPIWVQKKPGQVFHEFVCDWNSNKIEIIINGIKVFRITLKETLEWFNQQTAEQWVIINHSLRSGFIPDKDYTSEFLVDYIRVYKNI